MKIKKEQFEKLQEYNRVMLRVKDAVEACIHHFERPEQQFVSIGSIMSQTHERSGDVMDLLNKIEAQNEKND